MGIDGIEKMSKEDWLEWVRRNFNISGEADRMLVNILNFVETIHDTTEKYLFLDYLLDGTIGLTETEIRMLDF